MFPPGAFDSLGAVEMANSVNQKLGLTLPATLVYDYPSVSALSEHIVTSLGSGGAHDSTVLDDTAIRQPASHSAPTPSSARPLRLTRVARLPGERSSDAIGLVPFARWDLEAPLVPGEQRVRHAAFLPTPELFDPELFGMAAAEAALADPQHRVLLEAVYELLGDRRPTLAGRDTPVLVGIQQMEYGAVSSRHLLAVGPYSATASALSVAAGRVAFSFGLKGPAASVDSACSSALVATHVAKTMLLTGAAESAVAAGVNLLLSPSTFAAASAAGMLAPSARCRTLDSGADGYARAEACIAFLLEGCEGDACDGSAATFLAGSAINQDGRSSSLTAPHGPSQTAVLAAALRSVAAPGARHHALELHGTGTPLGDPIEIGAALPAMRGAADGERIGLSASKSRHGHGEPAAGAVGLTRMALALEHGRSSQILHLTQLNPLVANLLQGQTSVRIPRQAAPDTWGRAEQRLGGVSAFAFQGTNAHVVLGAARGDGYEVARASAVAWKRARCWYADPPRVFLARAAAPQRHTISVQCRLSGCAPLALLWDHVVNGRVLLPGAALFELVAEAIAGTSNTSAALAPAAAQANPLATDLALLRPGVLASHDVSDNVLTCSVSAAGPEPQAVAVFRGDRLLHARLAVALRSSTPLGVQRAHARTHAWLPINADVRLRLPAALAQTAPLPSQYAPQLGSFLRNPAQIDAATHLAAPLAALAATGPREMAVPASLQAYWPGPADHDTAQPLWSAGSFAQSSGADPAAEFRLGDQTTLTGLRFSTLRPQVPKESALGDARQETTAQPSPTLAIKAVEWQAAAPDAQELSGTRASVQLHVETRGLGTTLALGKSTTATASPAILSVLQQASRQAAPRAQLLVRRSWRDCPETSAVQALMRVASREQTDAQRLWTTLEISEQRAFALTPSMITDPPASRLDQGWQAEQSLEMLGVRQSAPAAVVGQDIVITGAMGTLGTLVTHWVAAQGARKLHLVARRPMAETSNFSAASADCCFTFTSTDTACASDLPGIPASSALPCLIHTAGRLADAPLVRQTARGLRETAAPKRTSLARLTARPWASVVTFSSLSAHAGTPGQANYAAANAAVDAVCAGACHRGLSFVSVQWGPWALGMAGASPALAASFARAGLAMLDARRGLLLLQGIWASGALTRTGVLIAAAVLEDGRKHDAQKHPGPQAVLTSDSNTRVSSASTSMPAAAVQSIVAELVQGLLGSRQLDDDEPLSSAGLDSMGEFGDVHGELDTKIRLHYAY